MSDAGPIGDRPSPEVAGIRTTVAGLRTAAFVLASSVIAGPLIVLLLTRAVLWQLNPRSLDLTDSTAYQVEVWVPCLIATLAMLVGLAVVFSRLARATGDRAALRYPSLVLQLQVGTAIAAIALVLLTPGVGF